MTTDHYQDRHQDIRDEVIQELKKNRDRYDGFFVGLGGLDAYITKMGRDSEWGDHVTLQAFANAYETSIDIISDYSGDECMTIVPGEGLLIQRQIQICFYAEIHYDSVRSK